MTIADIRAIAENLGMPVPKIHVVFRARAYKDSFYIVEPIAGSTIWEGVIVMSSKPRLFFLMDRGRLEPTTGEDFLFHHFAAHTFPVPYFELLPLAVLSWKDALAHKKLIDTETFFT